MWSLGWGDEDRFAGKSPSIAERDTIELTRLPDDVRHSTVKHRDPEGLQTLSFRRGELDAICRERDPVTVLSQ